MNKPFYLILTILVCAASTHYAMDKQQSRKERKDLVGDLRGQVHDLQQENRALHDQNEQCEHSIYLLRQQNQQLLHRIHDQQNNNHKLEQENKTLSEISYSSIPKLIDENRTLQQELNNQEKLCSLSSCCLLTTLVATNAAWYFATTNTIDKDKNA